LCVPPQACFELALRRKAFARAWRRPVDPEALAQLGRELGVGSGDVKTRKVE
jgi:hypothetical protein